MAKKSTKSGSSSRASKASKSAVSGRGDIRKRVRDLTVRAVRDGDLHLHDLPVLAREVAEGAAAGLDSSVPKARGNVLRQVVNGLTDAVSAAAGAAKTSATSVGERGAEFVRSDVRRTARSVGKLEEEALDSIARAGRKLRGAAREEWDVIVGEARRAGSKIGAAAKHTRTAADGRVLELGRESMDAGVRAARKTVGGILRGTGGFLEGLADAVTMPARAGKPPAKPAAPKKKSAGGAKKPATRSAASRKPSRSR